MASSRVEAPAPGEFLGTPLPGRRGRWGWLPGVVLLGAFLAFVFTRHAEEAEFLRLLRQARPGWLLVAAAFQVGTSLCVGAPWRCVLGRTGVQMPLLGLALLSLAVFLLDAATLGGVLRALGQHVPLSTLFVSFMLASVAETLSIIPGGVGTFEATEVALLTFLGLSVEAALAGTLLLRGFTLWRPGAWCPRTRGCWRRATSTSTRRCSPASPTPWRNSRARPPRTRSPRRRATPSSPGPRW